MSFTIRNTLALSALSAFAAAQTTPPKLEADCADVVIFMARGNDAPYHDGRTFPFVEATCGKFAAQGKTCDYIDIEFDVTLGGPYCDQVAEGARNGLSQITAFNQKCPCTHIVINGYSEGANVAGDVLGGPGGCEFVSPGLDSTSAAGKAIAAALLWGDPRHSANQTYNVLDGADKQVRGRPAEDLERVNRYSSVLRNYCAAGDPVCAGGDNVAEHLNYFELYTDEASSWVVSKLDNTAPLASCGTPDSTPTPSAPAAPVEPTGAANGTIAAPTNETIAAPTNGTIAAPVNGTIAAPFNGTIAAPFNGTIAAPVNGTQTVPYNGTTNGTTTTTQAATTFVTAVVTLTHAEEDCEEPTPTAVAEDCDEE